jgi:hypothetical protein
MTVLQRVTELEPGLKHEFRASVELMMPYFGPALKARCRMLVKKMERDLQRSMQGKSAAS